MRTSLSTFASISLAHCVEALPTAALFEALMRAFPFLADTVGLWQEYREWERLYKVRSAFTEYGDCDQATHVRARINALEHMLDTLSDWTFEGFAARLEWSKFRTEHDLSRDINEDLAMVDTMRLDFGVLHRMHMAQGVRDPHPPLAFRPNWTPAPEPTNKPTCCPCWTLTRTLRS